MRKPTTLARRIAAFGVAPVAVLIAGAMVWSATNAAFSSSSRNAGNNWSTGSVSLTDDDKGVAAFHVTNLVPGDTGQKCVVVTSNSSLPGIVKTYAQNLSASGHGLEKRITLTIEQGDGGSFNDCSGWNPDPAVTHLPTQTLEKMSTTNMNFPTGGAIWNTVGTVGEKKTYKGTWTFDTTGMTQAEVDALQGSSVSVDFVWELQNSL